MSLSLHKITELQKSSSTYDSKIKEGKATDKTMFSLSWDIEELKKLIIIKSAYHCVLFSVGFVSDGEFNYMRRKGYTRPLSVVQIRANVRTKYNKLHQRTLLAMLTPKRKL